MADQPELRYHDCPSTQAEVLIAAPAAVVWALVCDIQLPARFSSEFNGGEQLGGASSCRPPGARSWCSPGCNHSTRRSATGRPRPRSASSSPSRCWAGRSATRTCRRPLCGGSRWRPDADGAHRYEAHPVDADRARAERHQHGHRGHAGQGIPDPATAPLGEHSANMAATLCLHQGSRRNSRASGLTPGGRAGTLSALPEHATGPTGPGARCRTPACAGPSESRETGFVAVADRRSPRSDGNSRWDPDRVAVGGAPGDGNAEETRAQPGVHRGQQHHQRRHAGVDVPEYGDGHQASD